MFAGHVGIALAATRIGPRINIGALVAASLLLDLVLWSFILLGWEAVSIPADFDRTHQPEFVFPYSHSLLASVAWATLAAAIVLLRSGGERDRTRGAAVAASVVLSHWVLDVLVHRPELPLAGVTSRHVGLSLWDNLPAALAVEAVLTIAGAAICVTASRLPVWRKLGLAALVLLVLGFTIAGMTLAPPPPSPAAMAASSLVTILALCALMGWLGKSEGSSTLHARQ